MAPEMRRWRGIGTGILLGCVAAALLLAALRANSQALRLRRGDALREEQALLERKRELTVIRNQRRNPVELAKRARRLGFAPPEQVIELPVPPAPGSRAADRP